MNPHEHYPLEGDRDDVERGRAARAQAVGARLLKLVTIECAFSLVNCRQESTDHKDDFCGLSLAIHGMRRATATRFAVRRRGPPPAGRRAPGSRRETCGVGDNLTTVSTGRLSTRVPLLSTIAPWSVLPSFAEYAVRSTASPEIPRPARQTARVVVRVRVFFSWRGHLEDLCSTVTGQDPSGAHTQCSTGLGLTTTNPTL